MPQQIILIQRVGTSSISKPSPSSAIRTIRLSTSLPRQRRMHPDILVPVVAVAVHDGVHHALAHRHADAVLIFFVEARLPVAAFRIPVLGLIHALQRGGIALVQQFIRAVSEAISGVNPATVPQTRYWRQQFSF